MWPFRKKKPREKVNVGKIDITIELTDGNTHTWTVQGKLFGGDEYVVDAVEAAHEVIKSRLQTKGLMRADETSYIPYHRVNRVTIGSRHDHFV